MDELVLNSNIPAILSEKAVDFTRQIGQALLYHGIDVNKRIINMIFYGFIYVPLLFLVCWYILCRLFYKHKPSEEGADFLNTFVAFIIPSLILNLFSRLSPTFITMASPVIYLSVITIVIYLRFGEKYFDLNIFKWCFFTSLSLEFFGFTLIFLIEPEIITCDTSYMMYSAIIFIICMILTCCLGIYISKKPKCNSIITASTALYIAPILASIFIEFVNILSRYEIFISMKNIYIMGIFILCIAIWIINYRVNSEKFLGYDYTSMQYFLLVLGIAMISLQPPFHITAHQELFESSNAGSDIYSFLTNGEIPMIENLNVHMIIAEIGNILYGYFNSDAIGAVYFGYPFVNIISYLILYAFFSILTCSKEKGVLLTLFFPVNSIGWLVNIFGLLPIITACFAVKKKELKYSIYFVLSCIFTCMFSADIGLSCSFATFFVITAILIFRNDTKKLTAVWSIGIFLGSFVILIFMFLCLWRGISPIARFLEMIGILLATHHNWAYSSVADINTSAMLFFIVYMIIPSLCTFCFINLFFHRKKSNIPIDFYIIVLSLFIAHFFNYYRGIVRHNLLEKQQVFTLGFAALGIIIVLWRIYAKKIKTLPIFISLIFILQLLWGSGNLTSATLFQNSINRQQQILKEKALTERKERVIISEDLKKIYKPLKNIFDATLKKNQTFFDYSCSTLLYALTGRDKPVYTNQSPSQLNKEFDSLLFIKELEEADCPYALCNAYFIGFDGVDFDIKHYLAAEYRNKNYVPLCLLGNYTLWVRNNEYYSKRGKLENLISSGALDATILEINDKVLIKNYTLGYIPYLWAKYDKAVNQKILYTSEKIKNSDGLYAVDTRKIDRSNGNYIKINAISTQKTNAVLELLDGYKNIFASMTFDIFPDRHDYLIRISSNLAWYTDLIQYISIKSQEGSVSWQTLDVLKGDIDYESMNFFQRLVLSSDLSLNAGLSKVR